MDVTVLVLLIAAFRVNWFPILLAISGVIMKLVSTSIQWRYVGMTLFVIGGFECFASFLLKRVVKVHGIEYNLKVGDGKRFERTISVDPEDKEE